MLFTNFIFKWKTQLQFVAHPNVQQLLASIWYEGLPGFRRKNMVLQALEIIRIGGYTSQNFLNSKRLNIPPLSPTTGILFPLFSLAYIIAPYSTIGQTMRKPFIKFICHSASYFTFLCKDQLKKGFMNCLIQVLAPLVLLMLASQRIETFIGGWFWHPTAIIQDEVPTKRGAKPTFIEWMILAWVSGKDFRIT